MAAKKTLKFGISKVRNQLEHGSLLEYNVETKEHNGPSAVSNSALRTSQKANPNSYQWNTSKSYENTYTMSAANKAESVADYQKVRGNWGNNWVNATVAINTYKETTADINRGYLSKLTRLINKNFGNPFPELFAEIVDYVEELNSIVLSWKKGVISEEQANEKMDSTFDSAEEFIQIKKSIFKILYPEFRDLYLTKLKFLKKAKTLGKKTLKELRNARTLKNSKVRNP